MIEVSRLSKTYGGGVSSVDDVTDVSFSSPGLVGSRVSWGQMVMTAGTALRELRPADSAGLEEIFLNLTADDQREGGSK